MTIHRLIVISIFVFTIIPHAISAEEFNTKESPNSIEIREHVDFNRRLDSIVRAEVSRQCQDGERIDTKIKLTCDEKFYNFLMITIAIMALFFTIIGVIIAAISIITPKGKNTNNSSQPSVDPYINPQESIKSQESMGKTIIFNNTTNNTTIQR